MAFEWQPRERAAETLEVDVETLQAWIDSGHAPSRGQGDGVEVLIEFPDEADDAGAEPADKADDASEDPAATAAEDAGPFHADSAEPGLPPHHPIEVVSKRELQMAGGMVAAWQRLAETTDHELSRSRRWGAVAWSLVAALILLGGAGLWWATRTVSETEVRASLIEHDLDRAARQTAGDRGRIAELEQALSDLRARLADAERRADVTAARNEQLAEQHRLAQQRIDRRAESDQTLAAALRDTAEEQRNRISDLEEALSEARRELADTRSQLTDALEQLNEAGENF